ncbi:MAG: hypothetical protein KGJ43_03430, partial [Acidobacteriota bacterium]|nr:hypothetical protein [Acidobacteriota bacterium]
VTGSERVLQRLRAAGVPDVQSGQRIATALVATFQRAAAELGALRPQVAALPTGSEAFRAAATRLATSLNGSLTGIDSGLQGLRSPQLEQAAARSAACRSLSASAG